MLNSKPQVLNFKIAPSRRMVQFFSGLINTVFSYNGYAQALFLKVPALAGIYTSIGKTAHLSPNLSLILDCTDDFKEMFYLRSLNLIPN